MMMVKMTITVMMLELKQSFSIQKIEQVLYLISQMLTVMTVPNKDIVVHIVFHFHLIRLHIAQFRASLALHSL